MLPSIIGNARHVADEYRRFIRSTYRLADERLRAQFERHVDDAEVLVKGPYVTLAREFAAGATLNELVKTGAAPAALEALHWSFGRGPLYAHQEQAFRAASEGRNILVTTGTGSGKTEAFLLPVIAEVMKARAAGVTGTKALLLYPMNALANDQLLRLRKLVDGSGVPLTFALYTGESERVAPSLGAPLDGHEVVRRDDIRRVPPDIILTNYKQLEFLLVRNVDRPLFSPALRALVLDELHSYRGALATEIACLVRRLKARCRLQSGALRCFGTSATVSQDAGGDAALARFARTLFNEDFSPGDVIGERYAPAPQAPSTANVPLGVPAEAMLASAAKGEPGAAEQLAEQVLGVTLDNGPDVVARIQTAAAASPHIQALQALAGPPRTYVELAEAWRAASPAAAALTLDKATRAAEALILLGSIGDDDRPPLLRPKLHSFFHGVYDVGLCLNPGCRTLSPNGQEHCTKCGAAVRPAVLCRTCGQDYVKVRWDTEQPNRAIANDEFFSTDDTAFIASRIVVESEQDDADGADGAPAPPRARRRGAATPRWGEAWVEHTTGVVSRDRPADPTGWSLQHVLRGKGSSCPICKGRYPRGDILALLRTGQAASVSVLTTHHLDNLEPVERKLLVFADNRQEAAHQAGFMGDRHRQFAVRHAVWSLVQDAGPAGLAVENMNIGLLEVFQRLRLAPARPTQPEASMWHQALRYEVAGEFCRSTLQRVSLENLGLVAIEYEFLSDVIAAPAFRAACDTLGLTTADGGVLIRAMLDFMRRRRAVSFNFYQMFINESRAPWSYLAAEPYSISIAEHERAPVAFMLDRPPAARGHGVSGWTFNALVKDAQRGAAGGVPALVRRATGNTQHEADAFIQAIIPMLEEHDILIAAQLPERVRNTVGNRRAYQISARVLRAVPASAGFRCAKCQAWRPYHAPCCVSSSICSGTGEEQRPAVVDNEHYYVRLYTQDRPRRLIAREHTAQVDDQVRARRETDFKEGKLDVLVCSPTLELGVDIGQLPGVVLRNAPPTPANYLQRAGRAGRQLRIGYVSTFCSTMAHDRHCFERPDWLVRGEFRPPSIRMTNERIVARHARSLALEELGQDFSWLMGDLLADEQNPADLSPNKLNEILEGLAASLRATQARAAQVFSDTPAATAAVEQFPADLRGAVTQWHDQVKRLHNEFQQFDQIVRTRENEQRRHARQRAYRELTADPQRAHVLTWLADVGLLPSYQFPTDTFALDPGVADTPTLRRPAWIALFEFAPGNLVYANGHKLRNIRAFFAGGGRRSAGASDGGGQVEQFCFCESCGFASRTVVNSCPRCQTLIQNTAQVALLESFEAEENTQITSAEDSRQRVVFDRAEYVLDEADRPATLYPYDLITLEYRERAPWLATNWGKLSRRRGAPVAPGRAGERFILCPSCGRHQPSGLTGSQLTRWNDDHARFCNGTVDEFILGYQFNADALVLPVPAAFMPPDLSLQQAFVRTLGKAMLVGAQELLEIEPDEIAFMAHRNGASGWSLAFYETAPGGAGYLAEAAAALGPWARAAHQRLFGHDCERACYSCLKSYRNQFEHALLDKTIVREFLFALGGLEQATGSVAGRAGDGMRASAAWITERSAPISPVSEIEEALARAIQLDRRLPEPVRQYEVRDNSSLLTIPDFAYPDCRIAVFCDGFAFHGNVQTLSEDARKRNRLQAMGWLVLTFWGRQILRDPTRCVEEIRAVLELRNRTAVG